MSERIKLLLDEHIWEGLAEALRQRGYDVVHINHTPYRGTADEALLTLAASQGRAVLTFDRGDFTKIVGQRFLDGRSHAGVILSKDLPRGELLRRTERLLKTLSAEELADTIRYLSEFASGA